MRTVLSMCKRVSFLTYTRNTHAKFSQTPSTWDTRVTILLPRDRRKRTLITFEISAKFLRASRSFLPLFVSASFSHLPFVSANETCHGAVICYETGVRVMCNTTHTYTRRCIFWCNVGSYEMFLFFLLKFLWFYFKELFLEIKLRFKIETKMFLSKIIFRVRRVFSRRKIFCENLLTV